MLENELADRSLYLNGSSSLKIAASASIDQNRNEKTYGFIPDPSIGHVDDNTSNEKQHDPNPRTKASSVARFQISALDELSMSFQAGILATHVSKFLMVSGEANAATACMQIFSTPKTRQSTGSSYRDDGQDRKLE